MEKYDGVSHPRQALPLPGVVWVRVQALATITIEKRNSDKQRKKIIQCVHTEKNKEVQ